MNTINKTNKQLHREFEAALRKLEEKTYNLLYYGSYQLSQVIRDLETKKVNSAMITIEKQDGVLDGEHKLFLSKDECGGTSVTLYFDNNPINQTLLDSWDRQIIDRDIKYHREQLTALEELKKTFNS